MRSGGSLLLSVLVTLVIMAGLWVLVDSDTSKGIGNTLGETGSISTITGLRTGTPPALITAADVANCKLSAQVVASAIQDYVELKGLSGPGLERGITLGDPATYDQGKVAKALLHGGYLNSWPRSSAYAVSVSTTVAGDVAVYVPPTTASPVNYEQEGRSRGCNAI